MAVGVWVGGWRPYSYEACENCGSPFRAWTKHGRYCSNTCSVRANPKPQNQPKYPITIEMLELVDTETKGCNSPMKVAADLFGCEQSTVFFAAKRLGYVWLPRRKRRGENGPTTSVEQNYAKETGCVVCGETRVVDAAHLIPRTEGGITQISNIVPLCPTHHRLYDRGKLSEEENDKLVAFLFIKYPTLREDLEETKNGREMDSESNEEDGAEGDAGLLRKSYA